MSEFANEFFDEGYNDCGGKEWPFERVYIERPDFVEKALNWISATGKYGQFKEYCHWRKKIVSDASIDS